MPLLSTTYKLKALSGGVMTTRLRAKSKSVLFTIKGATFRFMDSEGHAHSLTPSTSIFVNCDDEAELRKAHEKLTDGGFELMELGEYPFAKLYSWVQDRYGLTWQLSLT